MAIVTPDGQRVSGLFVEFDELEFAEHLKLDHDRFQLDTRFPQSEATGTTAKNIQLNRRKRSDHEWHLRADLLLGFTCRSAKLDITDEAENWRRPQHEYDGPLYSESGEATSQVDRQLPLQSRRQDARYRRKRRAFAEPA